jgi:hypothetical protein
MISIDLITSFVTEANELLNESVDSIEVGEFDALVNLLVQCALEWLFELGQTQTSSMQLLTEVGDGVGGLAGGGVRSSLIPSHTPFLFQTEGTDECSE